MHYELCGEQVFNLEVSFFINPIAVLNVTALAPIGMDFANATSGGEGHIRDKHEIVLPITVMRCDNPEDLTGIDPEHFEPAELIDHAAGMTRICELDLGI